MIKETYWNHNGKYQKLADALNELIPVEGSVKNPRKNKALEKFRKASNCYYDLYNNGLWNRAREFAAIFKIRSSDYKIYNHDFSDRLYELTEEAMDEIVFHAWIEQADNFNIIVKREPGQRKIIKSK